MPFGRVARRARSLGLPCTLLLLAAISPAALVAQEDATPRLVSVAAGGVGAGNAGASAAIDQDSISADGRYVVFVSASSDLVAPHGSPPVGDLNGTTDVFLRDLEAGTTTLVSRSIRPGALTGNGASDHASISRDGRFVVFTSHASDLDAGDNNACEDVFVFDRVAGTVERISVSTAGAVGNNDSGFDVRPRISRDGDIVVFASTATNLVGDGDSNGVADLFVRDRRSGTTRLVTRNVHGTAAARYDAPLRARYLFEPRVSPDGRYVAFGSFASDLVLGDVNNTSDTFLVDLGNGLTVRVCPSPRNDAPITPYLPPQFSGNGLYLVFDCDGIVTPGDFSGRLNVFRRYLVTGRTEVVSAPPGSTRGSSTGDSRGPATNHTGDVVAFTSLASDLLPGETVIGSQLYARRMDDAATTILSATPSGQPGTPGTFLSRATLSADGTLAAFTSPSADLASPPSPVGADEVYLRNRTQQATVRVSVNVTGGDPSVPPNTLGADPAAISEDGSRILFASQRANLAAGDGNGEIDLFAAVALPPAANGATLTMTNSGLRPITPPEPFIEGTYDALTVDFTWQNVGNLPLPEATIRVPVPSFSSVVPESLQAWTCAPGADRGACTFPIGAVAPGQAGAASITFAFNFDALFQAASESTQRTFTIPGSLDSAGVPLARAVTSFPMPPSSLNTLVTSEEEFVRTCALLILGSGGVQPPSGSTRAAAGAALDVPAFYQVRDLLRGTPAGLRYVDLYYRHSPALVDVFVAEASLRARALAVVLDWQDLLRALTAGQGEGQAVTPERVETLVTLLQDIANAGSPELRAAILDELTRFPAEELGVISVAAAARRLGVHDGGAFERYFAEGAATGFFRTVFGLANPGTGAVDAVLRFLTKAGQTITHALTIAPLSRATVDAADVPGLAPAEFSTVVESTRPLVADRTMSWDGSGYGSHGEAGLAAPALTWYLAEGATHSGFDLFYLLQNPNPVQTAEVTVRYLLPSGAPLLKTYSVPPASRFNIWVDEERFDVGGLETLALASSDVSAAISVTNGVPILVERAMYLTLPGQAFGAGHASAGVTAAQPRWVLAEGATGDYFDLFVLVANPTSAATRIRVRYLLPSGQVLEKEHEVPASSRFNIWVDHEELPAGSGQFPLSDTPVSTIVESIDGVPIIVERAMWWPGPRFASTWLEAHNSPGAASSGTSWALGDGEVGGPSEVETYALVANVSSIAGLAKVTLLFDDGTNATKYVTVSANSRTNVAIGAEFPEASGRRFGVTVESVGAPPPDLVVERAMYSNAAGMPWAAGTNALGTRMR